MKEYFLGITVTFLEVMLQKGILKRFSHPGKKRERQVTLLTVSNQSFKKIINKQSHILSEVFTQQWA